LLLVGPYLLERMERKVAVAVSAGLSVALLVLYFAAGTQNRGGLMAGFIVVVAVPLVSRRFGLAMAGFFLALIVLFGVAYATDFTVDLGRRDVSVRQLIDNLVSIREGEDTGRIDLWSPVLDDVLTQEHLLNGLGFGENLADRYNYPQREDDNPLRNVHNSHLNVLARMGAVGVGFWMAVWGFWYYHLFRARARLRMVDSPRRAAYLGWAMLAVTAILVNAIFDGTLEGPQVAVWMWSIVGLGTAIALEANVREWQRRRGGYEGGRDIAREGGEENPLELSLRRLKKAPKRGRYR
jgi:O-antigen ligase